ncbi:MAG: hypothetical protein KJ729_09450 [Euryarchaeota archaeon]|nr:hypothetical protein [Euryarchaeota archaeon]
MRIWILIGLFILLSGCLETQSQSPTLLNSSITKIEAHSLDGDFIIINIYNNTMGIEVSVYDLNENTYKGTKQIPLKQNLPDIERFINLFNKGMKSKHVEAPLERAMSSDYEVLFYLKDGRYFIISQIIRGPILIEDKTNNRYFYLENYSIPFQSPLRDIGVKTFDLSPKVQEKFFNI